MQTKEPLLKNDKYHGMTADQRIDAKTQETYNADLRLEELQKKAGLGMTDLIGGTRLNALNLHGQGE